MIYLLVAGLMVLALFLFLLIELKKSLHLLYVIPITLFFFTGVYFFYDSVLGYPKKGVLEEKFLLISHYIPPSEKEIYLWVQKSDESVPVAIEIPYTVEDHKRLEKGKKMMEEGKLVEGKFLEGQGSNDKGGYEKGEGSSYGTRKSRGGILSLDEMSRYKFLDRKN